MISSNSTTSREKNSVVNENKFIRDEPRRWNEYGRKAYRTNPPDTMVLLSNCLHQKQNNIL